jgi:MFS family permease
MIGKIGKNIYRESGLLSVYTTGRDAWLIILCRSCRMFSYGAGSLVLALFFSELEFSDSRIGLFMTLTLLGDVFLSLLLSLMADRIGRRRTLFGGSIMMILSGIIFALFENYWILLFAAVVGVISATGGDFGPFRVIEESTLSELTDPSTRADVLAWYVTIASLGSSIGTILCGRAVEWFQAQDGWTLLDAYHACFWLYAITGGINLASSMILSDKCELQKPPPEEVEDAEHLLEETNESDKQAIAEPKKSRFSEISRETRSIMYGLWFLLMVDSIADGMVNMSLTTYYIDQKFHVSKSALGDMLSAGYFIASCSTIFSGPLARHLGLVNTMVFTHVPSSTGVLLFPLPQSIPATFALLLLRLGLNNMDQAPRAALIAAVVKAEERTAVMGVTTTLRSLASTVGPFATGILAGNDRFWIAFIVAGSLRLAYDFGLFAMFINIKLYKHEPVSQQSMRETSDSIPLRQRSSDDEESVEDY